MTFLLVLAVLAAVAGLLQLSQATLGVGLIAMGCFFGILARIEQARSQNKSSPVPPSVERV
jgi:hypothetical protein